MARILVVDDDDQLRFMVRLSLEEDGHTVETAENGLEATKGGRHEAFDLVITDVIMPEKEGLETIMDMRKTHPGLKIIAVSGGGRLDAERHLLLAQRFGACRTMKKPFSFEELLKTVKEVLAE